MDEETLEHLAQQTRVSTDRNEVAVFTEKLQLNINEKTTDEEVKRLLESGRKYANIRFGFHRTSDLKKAKEIIKLLLTSLAETLLHVTFSYPDSEVLEMILKLPNLKSIRIFDLKNYEPLQLTEISESIESAFIDEGFHRMDAELLKHMPNLKELKVQWLYRENLEKIVKIGMKLEKVTYMYRLAEGKLGQFYSKLKKSEKSVINQNIRFVKMIFLIHDETILMSESD